MKLLLILLFPVLLFAQKMPYDTIHGKIKQVREKMIFLDSTRQTYKLFRNEGEYGHNGFMNRKFTLSRNYSFWYELPFVHYVNYERNYDINGNIIQEKWYYKNNEVLTEYQFKYIKNNLIEEREIGGDGEIWNIKRYQYRNDGKLLSEVKIFLIDDGIYSLTTYEYDAEGKIKKINLYNDDGENTVKQFNYINNTKQVYIKRRHIWLPENANTTISKDTTLLKCEYVYDDKGNVSERKTYLDNPVNPPYSVLYKYDDQHNLTEISTTNSQVKYHFNKWNLMTGFQHTHNGKLQIKVDYTFNAKLPVKLNSEEDEKN